MSPLRQMAKRLKALRKDRGMTQEQLAKRAGIARTYLARLETAKQEPTLGVIEKLAKALKISAWELLK